MNQELSRREQITKWLAYYGLHEYVEIEPEAEPYILNTLLGPDVKRAYINENGGLTIELDDTKFQRSQE